MTCKEQIKSRPVVYTGGSPTVYEELIDMTDRELLMSLLAADGISGDESAVITCCEEWLGITADRSHLGSGLFTLQNGEGPHIALEAHLDSVGFVVTSVEDTGFITLGNVGGIDSRLLPASVLRNVRTHAPAVACSTPPHLSKGETKVLSVDEMWFDTGCDMDVKVGDRYVFGSVAEDLGERIVGPNLDDRAGVCAVLLAAKELLNCGFTGKLSLLLSSMEEIGEKGAAAGAFALQPDLCLCVDVSFAYREGLPKRKCGIGGGGPMIGFAPSLPRRISDGLCAAAENNGIPYQKEIMSGTTGTDADRITITAGGVSTGLVSIPLYEMHTPLESIWFKDLEATAHLLAAFCKEGGGLL